MLNIGIIGLGLIGGSLGLALHKYTSARVMGYDQDNDHLHYALQRGIIDNKLTEEKFAYLDLLFLAVPVRSIFPVLQKYYPVLEHRQTIVTDMGSTKTYIYQKINSSMPEIKYIGGHPLAGKEISGPEGAEADLFYRKNYILFIPDDREIQRAAVVLENILKKINCNILYMSPEKHDKFLAFSSHLPQLISTCIMLEFAELEKNYPEIISLLGTGFLDMTRLAASDPEMWVDIFTTNDENIIKNINNYINRLLELKNIIENKDQAKIFSYLTDARNKRRDM